MKKLLLATAISAISCGAFATSFELSEDINAVMWNSIGKTDQQITERIAILEKAANPRTQAERDADAPTIKRYSDTIVVDSLHVGAVGFPAGFDDERFGLSLHDSHLKGFTLLSGTISNGDANIGVPPLEAAADTNAFLNKKDDGYVPISTVADVHDAHKHGKTGVALNVQGSDAIRIEHMIDDVYEAYKAGIRTSNIAYNVDNQYGRGGNSNVDLTLKGLTPAGEKLVTEYNRVGMVVDC
ncbi:MAG: membrane dipeptidase, partial [Psychromonas sp.]